MTTAYPEVERTDMFEQLFQRLEEESERRALEEEERDMLEPKAEPSPVSTVRDRRRGSVSISRVGSQFETSSTDSQSSQSQISSRGSRSSSINQTRRNFYQLDSSRADSIDSFASETTTEPFDDVEDSHHVAQTHFIPAQSISKAISRRLSRAKDLMPLASPTSASTVVIGVAVEANTIEHDDVYEGIHTTTTTTVCSGTLRPRRSTPLLNEKVNFLSKAKDITSKLRRKSVAALTPTSR